MVQSDSVEDRSKPGAAPAGLLAETAREANRHLRWLQDAGERTVPAIVPTSTRPSSARRRLPWLLLQPPLEQRESLRHP